MGKQHDPARLCRRCIHQGHCAERNLRGPCIEYRTDDAGTREYLHWYAPVQWYDIKRERKR